MLEGGRCRGRQKKCWVDNVKGGIPSHGCITLNSTQQTDLTRISVSSSPIYPNDQTGQGIDDDVIKKKLCRRNNLSDGVL
ncbi:hypothetical protein DPMN_042990 [Dreissena polymorpha]|uniref:Uncharacterized protein n=1 Tax=Dreissena polymorpha TaxID=45954 RepID=A0A9D4D042_DREPO|nr:hypothetical protein DPMN_042990 [Dreissena polymorpha]